MNRKQADTLLKRLWHCTIVKILCWLLIVAVTLAILIGGIPYAVNSLILKDKWFDIVGDEKVWLGFWATYIGAIASFAMVFTTWWTLKHNKIALKQNDDLLKQNKEQLNELKRQWKDQNEPKLYLSIKYEHIEDRNECKYELIISNAGQQTANNVTFKLSKESINELGIKNNKLTQYLESIGDIPFNIYPNSGKIFPIINFNISKNDDTITFMGTERESWQLYLNTFTNLYKKEIEISYEYDTFNHKSIKCLMGGGYYYLPLEVVAEIPNTLSKINDTLTDITNKLKNND